MRRPRGILLVILIFLTVGTLLTLRFGTGMHASGFVKLRVAGRLVDETTGASLADGWVLVLPSRSWARDMRVLTKANEEARAWDRLRRSEAATLDSDGRLVGPFDTGGAFTQDDGAFTVVITQRWSQYLAGILDPGEPLPPRYRTGALMIEIEGREPVLLDAPHGTWTEHPDGDKILATTIWATYDMGVIRVPPGE